MLSNCQKVFKGCGGTEFHVLSRTWTQYNDFLFHFLNFDTVFKNSSPEKNANIWRTERDGKSAVQFEAARVHFLSRDFKIQRRDGNENVAKKVNLRSFSLYRNYLYPLTLSNVGEPSWSRIPRHHMQVQYKRNKISSLLVYVLHKTRN